MERMMKTFIDNPWDEVQRQIEEVAEDELLDDRDPSYRPTPAEQAWALEKAKRIASRVMNHLDGGDYPADKHGLRCSATEATRPNPMPSEPPPGFAISEKGENADE